MQYSMWITLVSNRRVKGGCVIVGRSANKVLIENGRAVGVKATVTDAEIRVDIMV